MTSVRPATQTDGLSLDPFRALRPAVPPDRLAGLLCPPYDVIDSAARARLLATDADNAVALVLPDPTPQGYSDAAARLSEWTRSGLWRLDGKPALYIYEMADGADVTRGLVGAVELHDPRDGVILPHENTMAAPVADRLQVMTATGADLEPIYLVYDGGGAASRAVRRVDMQPPIASATTSDGVTHRLWAITDATEQEAIRADLATRRALIADGHHRYATYRERQRLQGGPESSGPWNRGLALLVDSSEYGPQVHAIHRSIRNLTLAAALGAVEPYADVHPPSITAEQALTDIDATDSFAVVLTDGQDIVVITDRDGRLRARTGQLEPLPEVAALDVSTVHRVLVEQLWQLPDDVDHVGYAHTVEDAIADARDFGGVAVLLRSTPVAAVAAVAAAGGRMPRKSTLFTPKPASGLLIRRLADQA